MKLILTGSSGFIGGEVLSHCIQHPSVTSIIALTRTPLPPSIADNPKVQVFIVEDFLSYSPSVLQATKGADACIWSQGKAWMNDLEAAKTVNIDYPLTAARTFTSQVAKEVDGKTRPFRYVYLSGGLAEQDQNRSLWWKQDYRHIRGQIENELLAHREEHPDTFEPYIIRPAAVTTKHFSFRDAIRGLLPSIQVDALAKVMLKIALDGYSEIMVRNPAILEQAAKA